MNPSVQVQKDGLVRMALLLLLALVTSVGGQEGQGDRSARISPQDLPTDPAFWQRLETLPPTPQGDGYLPDVVPGQFLQFRYAVPPERPPVYLVNLDNVVAMRGGGAWYQVEIHVDSPDGPRLYKGPKITNDWAFNCEDLSRLDATRFLTDQHLKQGFLDLWVTAWAEGDTWTVYRDHDGTGYDLFALVPDPAGFARWQQEQEAREEQRRRGVLLLPQPQRLQLGPEDFTLGKDLSVALVHTEAEEDRRTAANVAAELSEHAGVPVPVVSDQRPHQVRLALAPDRASLEGEVGFPVPDEIGEQGYALEVGPDGAVAAAHTSVGLFYAAQTLSQLPGRNHDQPVIKGVRIVDWPDLKYRMMQYDIARGNTVQVEYWKHWIRDLSRLKVNQIMLYMEDDYRFQKYPFLGRPDTFTPEKARELVDFARAHHVELVPQIESLGHAGALLSHPELQDLRLAGDPGAICPCAERTRPVLDDLFGELAEAFPQSPLFHVGADEVWGFGNDERCAAQVRESGEEGVYAFHLNNLQQLLAKRGRKMAFWGDEVLAYPKVADTLTRDCVVFDWHYGDQRAYPSIDFFQQHGFPEIYVCPAVHGYFDVYPQYRLAFGNISGFTREGVKKGVAGVCCTTWGMNRGGNAENYLYGLAYAAQCAWSSETERKFFDDRFAAVWFGLPNAGGRFTDVDQAFWFAWRGEEQAPFWQQLFRVSDFLFGGCQDLAMKWTDEDRDRLARQAVGLKGLCAEATAAIGRLRAGATRNAVTLDALQHAVNLHQHVAGKVAAMAQFASDYRAAFAEQPQRPPALQQALDAALAGLRALRAEYPTLEAGFDEAIRSRCGDPNDRKLFRQARDSLDAYLARVEQAQADLAAGKSPPEPAALGLGWLLQVRVWQWRTPDINPSSQEKPRRIVVEVTEHVRSPGTYVVEWDYTDGQDGLDLLSTGLYGSASPAAAPDDLQPLALDEHHGFTGAADSNHRYTLRVEALPPGERVFLVGLVYNQRTFNTAGDVWLMKGWEREAP